MLGYIACLCLKIPIYSGNATYQFQTIKSINNTILVYNIVLCPCLFNIVNQYMQANDGFTN